LDIAGSQEEHERGARGERLIADASRRILQLREMHGLTDACMHPRDARNARILAREASRGMRRAIYEGRKI